MRPTNSKIIDELENEIKSTPLLTKCSITRPTAFKLSLTHSIPINQELFLRTCTITIEHCFRYYADNDTETLMIEVVHNLVKLGNVHELSLKRKDVQGSSLKVLICIILEIIDTFERKCDRFHKEVIPVLQDISRMYKEEIERYNADVRVIDEDFLNMFESGRNTNNTPIEYEVNLHGILDELKTSIQVGARYDILKKTNPIYGMSELRVISSCLKDFENREQMELVRVLKMRERLENI